MPKAAKLGILGGLGPMASVYFYEMLTAHTKASCDAEHIDLVLSSRATTPDRTAYIIGQSEVDPRPAMIEDAKKLQDWGCTHIAIPCNTAHYFYDSIAAAVSVPVLNIMEETAACLAADGIRCAGILATDGTVLSHSYEKYLDAHGIRCVLPSSENQMQIMQIIYGQIKKGQHADMRRFRACAKELFDLGAERIILGCTELSLIKREEHLSPHRAFLDSMEVLAKATILACGKEPIGFDF